MFLVRNKCAALIHANKKRGFVSMTDAGEKTIGRNCNIFFLFNAFALLRFLGKNEAVNRRSQFLKVTEKSQ
jgi:hypothetical protein